MYIRGNIATLILCHKLVHRLIITPNEKDILNFVYKSPYIFNFLHRIFQVSGINLSEPVVTCH